ncbi:MAG: hypothetical protein ACLR9P_04750 [Escherichia coli]
MLSYRGGYMFALMLRSDLVAPIGGIITAAIVSRGNQSKKTAPNRMAMKPAVG